MEPPALCEVARSCRRRYLRGCFRFKFCTGKSHLRVDGRDRAPWTYEFLCVMVCDGKQSPTGGRTAGTMDAVHVQPTSSSRTDA